MDWIFNNSIHSLLFFKVRRAFYYILIFVFSIVIFAYFRSLIDFNLRDEYLFKIFEKIIILIVLIIFTIRIHAKINIPKLLKNKNLFSIIILYVLVILLQYYYYNNKVEYSNQIILLVSSSIFLGVLIEELLFRHLIFFSIANDKGVLNSYVISSLLFGLIHYISLFRSSEEIIFFPVTNQVLLSASFGSLFAFLYLRFKSIIIPIVFHLSFNLLFGRSVLNEDKFDSVKDAKESTLFEDFTSTLFVLIISLFIFLICYLLTRLGFNNSRLLGQSEDHSNPK